MRRADDDSTDDGGDIVATLHGHLKFSDDDDADGDGSSLEPPLSMTMMPLW